MVGVDEVGRGCWAGPLLVVAARAKSSLPAGLTDSKLLSKKKREAFAKELLIACDFGEGWVSSEEIEKNGLAEALRLGVARALTALKVYEEEDVIIDGSVNYAEKTYKKVSCIVDADLLIPLVSAASIYAKVSRDRFMQNVGIKYPQYGFESHVGYGTKWHKLALEEHGILKNVHRLSFKPVRRLAHI
jgi:ribonuclease HII